MSSLTLNEFSPAHKIRWLIAWGVAEQNHCSHFFHWMICEVSPFQKSSAAYRWTWGKNFSALPCHCRLLWPRLGIFCRVLNADFCFCFRKGVSSLWSARVRAIAGGLWLWDIAVHRGSCNFWGRRLPSLFCMYYVENYQRAISWSFLKLQKFFLSVYAILWRIRRSIGLEVQTICWIYF